MKESMSYRQQIDRAKQVVNSWTPEKKSWMQAQGTNEYVERRILDGEQKDSQLLAEVQRKK